MTASLWDGDDGSNSDTTNHHSDERLSDAGCEFIDPLLLTPEAAAEMLAISQATLWRLVDRDRIRFVEFTAAGFRRPVRRFQLGELQRFVEESTK